MSRYDPEFYVVLAIHPRLEDSALCVTDGYRNNAFESQQDAETMASEMREAFPDVTYVVRPVFIRKAIRILNTIPAQSAQSAQSE